MGRTMRIRTDDQVIVTGGKDAGKTGRVVRTEPKKRRVYVENLNIVKRSERPRSVKDTQKGGAQVGGIVEVEGPIHVSNVMLLDPKDNKPTRVGVSRESGKRTRVAKRSGKSID
jgi:large subunit ribosomal protein L24